MGYWPYKELFSDHKKPSHRIFFETGTYMGDSVQDAIDLGFETTKISNTDKFTFVHAVRTDSIPKSEVSLI